MKLFNILTIFLFILMYSCRDKLKPLSRGSEINLKEITVEADFCTINPELSKSFLKFIYVIDKSGSNRSNPGTDPTGSRRYDNLIQFVNTGSSDDAVFYSLINFSTESSLVSDFVTRNTFDSTARNQRNLTNPPAPAISNDDGWTNYGHTLDRIRSLIVNDVNRSKEALGQVVSSHYVIFFLSDGMPTDEFGNALTEEQIQNNLLPKIDSISNLKTTTDNDFDKWIESIKFSTGYYYNTTVDATAVRILEDMAARGNGEAHTFADGQAVDYTKFTLPERYVKHALKEVFVINSSTVWEDELLRFDYDGDGISDALEFSLGSNPDHADSDLNGVSDGVEYIVTGMPCAHPQCDSSGANPFHSCIAYIKDDWTFGDPDKYTDADGDLLNNCEEKALIGSDIFKFDTNDDWITDYLALRSKGAISILADPKVSGRLLDPDADGVTNYYELKFHTPWAIRNAIIPERFKPYQYKLTQTAKEVSRTCYNLVVHPVMVYDDQNLIQLHILEKSAIIDNRKFLRVIKQRASGPVLKIDIR